nr:FCD domain-containing protein [Sporosarcina luteola]
MDELFTVKEALEGFAAGVLTESGNEEAIEKVKESVALMEKAVGEKDHKLFVESNNQFHKAILDGANNSKMGYFYNLLLNQIPYNGYVYLSIDVPNRLEESLKEHQRILAAILSGDREAAEKTMRMHVKESAKGLKKGIAKKLYNDN